MLDATFACPDLTTFCRLDGLGLVVTGQRLEPDRAILACRVVDADPGDLEPLATGTGVPLDALLAAFLRHLP